MMAKIHCLSLLLIFIFLPKPIFANSQVVINELLPTPSSGKDWVELYNPSDVNIDISGWILDDEGTSTDMLEIPKDTVIEKKSFKLFYVSNRLNKSGDTVYLKSDGIEVDKYEYKSSETGVSYGRFPDGIHDWQECSPTPESANSNCQKPPEPSPDPGEDVKNTSLSSSNSKSAKSSPKASSSPKKSSPSNSKITPSTLGEKNISVTKLLPSSTPSSSPEIAEENAEPTKLAGFLTGFGTLLVGVSVLMYFYLFKLKEKDKDSVEKSE